MTNTNQIPLIEKYRPQNFVDIKGQDIAMQELKNFFRTFPRKKAIILNGPAGIGKTSLALAAAKEFNQELFELNASDLRNRAKLDEILKPSLEQQSLFKKSKLILMDEADGITGTDRGGLPELIVLLAKSPYPIIITANDIWQKKFSLLRQRCSIITLKELTELDVKKILTDVLIKERKKINQETLKIIIKKSHGDIRAALNDLQSVIDLGEEEFIQEIADRERQESIFNVLKKLFQLPPSEKTLTLFDNLDIELDEILLWIEENIVEEYKGGALIKAYESLSKADIFRGRIYRQQHWRFLVYQNFFMSAGIASASVLKNNRFIQYKRPSRVLKIWLANQKNQKRKIIAAKYAKFTHMSAKKANKESFLFPFILDNLDEKTKKVMHFEETDAAYIQEKKGAMIVANGLNRFRI
ncbi:MAG: replication factor C large subunit [Nanoarchaeota archaeon]